MTTPTEAAELLGPATSFGEGGAWPYERALGLGGAVLRLHALSAHPAGAAHRTATPRAHEPADVDVRRFLRDADRVDRAILSRTTGPVLDVGCGPGRMVAEALRRGRRALGIDVSSSAVELAAGVGLPVLRTSVFDDVPGEGEWHTLLLLDGNVGIGGDPAQLISRCAELLSPGGTLVVETHRDSTHERAYVARLVDDDGRASNTFPWAEVGSAALRQHVDSGQWRRASDRGRRGRRGRRFVLLERSRP